MQNMVTMLTSAGLFGGQGTNTQLDVSPEGFLAGGLCLFTALNR